MKAMIGVLTLLFSGSAFAADEPRTSLETAIPDMIKLLEAKDYKKLIETYAEPEMLKMLTKDSTIDEVAKQFGGDKAERLLKVLQAIKDVKPTMSDKDTKATYDLKEEISGKKNISFKKIDKNWYISN